MADYTPTAFVDQEPPGISAEELNKMGAGIKEAVAAIPELVSELPSDPFDGQEIYYQPDSSHKLWRFRYDEAWTQDAFKWFWVGGDPMRANINTQDTGPAGSLRDLATIGPQLFAPLAGVYTFSFGCDFYMQGGGPCKASCAPVFGSSHVLPNPAYAATVIEAYPNFLNDITVRSIEELERQLAVGDEVRLRYDQQANALMTIATLNRWLKMRPLRVG